MAPRPDILLSVLDLCPIPQGGTAGEAFRRSIDLARHAEAWGYHRYWVAEHHSIPGVASAATAVVIGQIAAATRRIRVGSGGIMLPNHAPLVIAEQFGTLESLFPGRIDLGLGRAPGGDRLTAQALRRTLHGGPEQFPQDVRELQGYFRSGAHRGAAPRAIPGEGLEVPIYLLGSSTFSAELAASMGLPFAFASHFAPDALEAALRIYRSRFVPSAHLSAPHSIVGVNVFAADTDSEAERLFTSHQQMALNLIRGHPKPMPPPVEHLDWNPIEETHVRRMTRVALVGGPDTLRRQRDALLAQTEADELIATAHIFDHAARLRSYEIAAEVFHRRTPSPA